MIAPEQVLMAQASHTKKLPKCLWFLLLLQFSLAAKHAPIASWDVPYNQLTEGETTRAWFTDDLLDHIQAPPRSGQLQHYKPFLVQL